MKTNETLGRSLGCLFEHEHTHVLTLAHEVVGQFSDQGRLTNTRASGNGCQGRSLDAFGNLVEAFERVGDGRHSVYLGDLIAHIDTTDDAIRSEGCCLEYRIDDIC